MYLKYLGKAYRFFNWRTFYIHIPYVHFQLAPYGFPMLNFIFHALSLLWALEKNS